MVQNFENPIINGKFTKKVYLIALSKPVDFSELTQIIYSKNVFDKNKDLRCTIEKGIVAAIKTLKGEYIELKGQKFISKIEPLIDLIEKDMGQIPGKNKLKKKFDSKAFRSMIKIEEGLEFVNPYEYYKILIGFGAFMAIHLKEKEAKKSPDHGNGFSKWLALFMTLPFSILEKLNQLPPRYLIKTWITAQFSYQFNLDLILATIKDNPTLTGPEILQTLENEIEYMP